MNFKQFFLSLFVVVFLSEVAFGAIIFIEPVNNSYLNQTLVNFSVQTTYYADSVILTVNNTSYTMVGDGYNWSVSVNLSEGIYTATASTSNESASITFTVDITPPVFYWNHYPPNGSLLFELEKIDVDVYDNLSPVIVEWTTDNWTTVHTENISGDPVLFNPNAGNVVFQMRARDFAGNYNSTVYVAEYEIWKLFWGDYHWHTIYSDGRNGVNVAQMLANASKDLDWASPSDHVESLDDTEWANILSAVDSYNQDGVFVTFVGYEYTSHTTTTNPSFPYKKAHLNIIFPNTSVAVKKYSSATYPTLPDVLQAMWNDNAEVIAIIHHPLGIAGTSFMGCDWLTFWNDSIINRALANKYIKGVEIYSTWGTSIGGRTTGLTVGDKPYDSAHIRDDDRHWVETALQLASNHSGSPFWFTAGGDIHDFPTPYVGDYYYYNSWKLNPSGITGVFAPYLNRSNIYNGLKEGLTVATDHKKIRLFAKADDKRFGQRIIDADGVLNITVRAMGDRPLKIYLVKNNEVIAETPDYKHGNELAFTDTNASAGDFYYAVAWQDDGFKAWISPIYIDAVLTKLISKIDFAVHNSKFFELKWEEQHTDYIEIYVDGQFVGNFTPDTSSIDLSWLPKGKVHKIVLKAINTTTGLARNSSILIYVPYSKPYLDHDMGLINIIYPNGTIAWSRTPTENDFPVDVVFKPSVSELNVSVGYYNPFAYENNSLVIYFRASSSQNQTFDVTIPLNTSLTYDVYINGLLYLSNQSTDDSGNLTLNLPAYSEEAEYQILVSGEIPPSNQSQPPTVGDSFIVAIILVIVASASIFAFIMLLKYKHTTVTKEITSNFRFFRKIR